MVGFSLNNLATSLLWILLLGGLYAKITLISCLSVDNIMAMASRLIILRMVA
jgi:hypothetical protein